MSFILPDWPAPCGVKAFSTTSDGGFSQGCYTGFNLGNHVGDNPQHVVKNRAYLQAWAGDKVRLCWLKQTHSDIVVNLIDYEGEIEADAAVSSQKNTACLVMTADCLPILLCNQAGTKVAALHCGWRGLYQQLISKTLQQYFSGDTVIAWLGPAIGQASYEVDEKLYQQFIQLDKSYQSAFKFNRDGHYLLDLYQVARFQLTGCGVFPSHCFGGGFNTYDELRFFSYRRQNPTGRMVTGIYLAG